MTATSLPLSCNLVGVTSKDPTSEDSSCDKKPADNGEERWEKDPDLEAALDADPQHSRYCPGCGVPLAADDRKCFECGLTFASSDLY